LLIVPGGGDFADTVRNHYHRYRLHETTAHEMALLAMDQYGLLLGDLVPNGDVVRDILLARRTTTNGRVPILLPAALLIQADPLPHSWQVTSDSIAAWIAGLAGAAQLVLLKDVDGLLPDWSRSETAEVLPAMSVSELLNHRGGVDEYLAVLLASLNLETWIINGRLPERLAELLETGQTLGTRISRE
jgi:aspartokinase-like uncharacterized kinase